MTAYTDRAEAFAAFNLYAQETSFTYVSDDISELGMTFVVDGSLDIEQESVDEEQSIWWVRVGYQEV